MRKIQRKIKDYFIGVWRELKKIAWPKRSQVINHTLIVIASITVAIIFVTAIDFGLSRLVEYFISLS